MNFWFSRLYKKSVKIFLLDNLLPVLIWGSRRDGYWGTGGSWSGRSRHRLRPRLWPKRRPTNWTRVVHFEPAHYTRLMEYMFTVWQLNHFFTLFEIAQTNRTLQTSDRSYTRQHTCELISAMVCLNGSGFSLCKSSRDAAGAPPSTCCKSFLKLAWNREKVLYLGQNIIKAILTPCVVVWVEIAANCPLQWA